MDASSMEKYSRFGVIFFAAILISSCQSAPLKYKEITVQNKANEFDQVLKIEVPAVTSVPALIKVEAAKGALISGSESTNSVQQFNQQQISSEEVANKANSLMKSELDNSVDVQKSKKDKVVAKKEKLTGVKYQATVKNLESVTAPVIQPHLPSLEDGLGFNGRRPMIDPFRVGEEIKLRIHYMGMTAGEMRLKTEKFATVNSRKSYTFASELSTSSVFEKFYKMNDRAVTYVDFETLLPYGYSLDVKESGQLRTARQVFDYNTKKAKFWEVKVTEKDGQKEKKIDWDLPEYAQNVFTTIFYMRLFRWEVGKSYSFIVAHDGENLVFKGTALRKETIETDLGPKQAVVVKPELTLKGVFKPMGDIYFWFSDDDRKYILKIEAKIKIGSLRADVSSIYPGQ